MEINRAANAAVNDGERASAQSAAQSAARDAAAAGWQARAEAAEAELLRRDYEAALSRGLSGVAFTSEAARRDIVSRIRAAGLTVRDGALAGLPELLAEIRSADAGAFCDTAPVRFTEPLSAAAPPPDAAERRRSIMAIRDRGERLAAIAENLELFRQ